MRNENDMTRYATILFLICIGCGSGVRNDPGSLAVDWTSPSESLTATGFTLIVDGVTFHGTTDQFEFKAASAGDGMDVRWAEAGFTPRIHFDFESDGVVGRRPRQHWLWRPRLSARQHHMDRGDRPVLHDAGGPVV